MFVVAIYMYLKNDLLKFVGTQGRQYNYILLYTSILTTLFSMHFLYKFYAYCREHLKQNDSEVLLDSKLQLKIVVKAYSYTCIMDDYLQLTGTRRYSI